MKILRISLRNIASLAGTHTVDFTSEPLRSTGLFSISGPTGSGKSTLLDALCLALYEKTPRLNNVGRESKIDDAGEKISQSDPTNLLRRGTGEGFAEVAFIGVDAQTYTARWQVRRARNHAEGALQKTEVTLFRGNISPGGEGPIEQGGKKTEVHPVIERKIGLSFEQFTRAVLLAQNDFATFLKAKDHDRAEILQALTGTELFEKLSIAVYQKNAEEAQKLRDIDVQLSGNVPLSIEERTELNEAFEAANQAIRDLQAQLKTRESHVAWFDDSQRLNTELENAKHILQQHTTAFTEAEPRRLRLRENQEIQRDAAPLRKTELDLERTCLLAKQRLSEASLKSHAAQTLVSQKTEHQALANERFQTAAEAQTKLAPQIQRARELDAQMAPLQATLEQSEGRFRAAQKAFNNAQQAVSAFSKKCTDLRAALDLSLQKQARRQCLVPFAKDSAAWLDRISAAANSRRKAEQSARILLQIQQQIATQQESLTQALKLEATLKLKEEECRKTLGKAQAALSKVTESFSPQKQREVTAELHTKQCLLTELSNLDIFSAQLRDLSTACQTAQRVIQEDTALAETLRSSQIPQATKTRDDAWSVLQRTEAAIEDSTVALRGKLINEQPCPVCGSLEHPYSQFPPSTELVALRVLREDLEQKEAGLKELKAKLLSLENGIPKEQARLLEKTTAQEEARLRVAAAETKVRELSPAPESGKSPLPPCPQSILSEIETLKDTLKKLEASEIEFQAAETLFKRDSEAHQQAEKELQTCEKQSATLQHTLSLGIAEANAAKQTHETDKAQETQARNVLEPFFDNVPSSLSEFEKDTDTFGERIETALALTLQLEADTAAIQSELAQTESQKSPLENALTHSESELREREKELHVDRNQYEFVRLERIKLFDGKPVSQVENEILEVLQQQSNLRELAQKELQAAHSDLAVSLETLGILEASLKSTQSSYEDAESKLQDWLISFEQRTSRPLPAQDLETVLSLDSSWFSRESEFFETLNQSLHIAQGALSTHQQSLDKHLILRPTEDTATAVAEDISRIRQQLQQAELTLAPIHERRINDNRCIAQSSDLITKRQTLDAASARWRNLNELIGSAKGDKFQNIAQRRTLDVLLTYANAQLELFAGRYRLERLPESLNLIVVDRDMGEERRSVHSLSGGESFLVSLALALALASLTSNRLRIESLFIDEGFGSLDPSTLDTAMGALMQLEAQGRKVGVISHVSEMTDAIPVQIRVVKTRGGKSSLVVPGNSPVQGVQDEESPDDDAETRQGNAALATALLGVLERENRLGHPKVSTAALRKELGCSLSELNAARDSISEKVAIEGRSFAIR
ncbi:MAG: AAA family ATPase [Verrucomicrobiota bacterium]